MKVIKTILKVLLVIVIILVVLVGALLAWLTAVEYKPADTEDVRITQMNPQQKTLKTGDTINLMAWNIGYAALGDNADFFMDGGKMVYTADEARVRENLNAIVNEVKANDPDLLLVQEIDLNSDRSHHLNETSFFFGAGYNNSAFANNFKDVYAPFPIPPMGKIDSGIATFSKYQTTSATRVQLPCPFSWPVRTFNLKRCLLITRIPVDGGKELVIVNLHLEAYDDGEGKAAQAQMLMDVFREETSKGNYVIAGGDFNQSFSNVSNSFAVYPEQWQPSFMDVSSYEADCQFLMDSKVASCRSLYKPLTGNENALQYYMIDGFIVSINIRVESYQVKDLGFVNSDHNPQLLKIVLE